MHRRRKIIATINTKLRDFGIGVLKNFMGVVNMQAWLIFFIIIMGINDISMIVEAILFHKGLNTAFGPSLLLTFGLGGLYWVSNGAKSERIKERKKNMNPKMRQYLIYTAHTVFQKRVSRVWYDNGTQTVNVELKDNPNKITIEYGKKGYVCDEIEYNRFITHHYNYGQDLPAMLSTY